MTPKFLICENPMESEDVYIFHSVEPRAFIKVEPVENNDKLTTMEPFAFTYYLNPDGSVETHYLQVLAAFSNTATVGELKDIVTAAANWYKEYLKFIDGKIESDFNNN